MSQICRRCGQEYEEPVRVCRNCTTVLRDGPPPPPAYDEPDLDNMPDMPPPASAEAVGAQAAAAEDAPPEAAAEVPPEPPGAVPLEVPSEAPAEAPAAGAAAPEAAAEETPAAPESPPAAEAPAQPLPPPPPGSTAAPALGPSSSGAASEAPAASPGEAAAGADGAPVAEGARFDLASSKSATGSLFQSPVTWIAALAVTVVVVIVAIVAMRPGASRDYKAATAVEDQAGEDYEQAIEAYREFLEEHPTGKYADLAREKVEKTLPSKIDDREFRRASDAAAAAMKERNQEAANAAYQRYLDQFPRGEYAAEVRRVLRESGGLKEKHTPKAKPEE